MKAVKWMALVVVLAAFSLFIPMREAGVALASSSGAPGDCLTIAEKYAELSGPNGSLGAVVQPEAVAPDGVGHYAHYQGGSIYWSPQTCAHMVRSLIRDKWASLGWEQSLLGYPRFDEQPTRSGGGAFSLFQNGAIFWSPTAGAHEVHGAILGKWAQLGWDVGLLGFPMTDEQPTPDGVGRFNHFQGGSIYWSPQTGAHAVRGAIRAEWAHLGWERSILGYPTSDVQLAPDGLVCSFQRGRIFWSQQAGAHVEVLIDNGTRLNPVPGD